MHAFVIALGLHEVPLAHMAAAIHRIGSGFGLDARTAWQVRSRTGLLAAAGIHHGLAAEPRRYLHRSDRAVTLFDGLPVDPGGLHRAHDAAALEDGWDSWLAGLEGQYCAVRLDLERDSAEIQTDSFGLLPVFTIGHRGGMLVSNSVQAIRELAGADQPDPRGVSTMLGFGWAADRHTLLSGVRALPGGSMHRLTADGVSTRTYFGSEQLKRGDSQFDGAGELAERLADMVANGVSGIEPLRCGVTAGRDSRLLLALVRSRGLEADYYTIGRETDEDVVWARTLADSFGFPHRTVRAEHDLGLDWTAAAGHFLAQTDGLSSLGQLIDYVEQPDGVGSVGVKLWGIGCEIGRVGQTDTAISAAALPLLGSSMRMARKVLSMKADAHRGVMTAEAQQVLDASVADFAQARVDEGWRVEEIAELFFIFERVACHGSAGPRRAAAADDLFSPFCSRLYTEYCLSRPAAERYVEQPYIEMLTRVSPELRAFPFMDPLKPALPWMRVPRAAHRLGGQLLRRARREGASIALEHGRPPFAFEWFEQHLGLIEEVFAQPGSPLWELIDRPRVRALLQASPQERYPHLEPLLRAATVAWYFHGPGVG